MKRNWRFDRIRFLLYNLNLCVTQEGVGQVCLWISHDDNGSSYEGKDSLRTKCGSTTACLFGIFVASVTICFLERNLKLRDVARP